MSEESVFDESNTQLTMVDGCAIERDYIYIAQYFDKYSDYADEVYYTRLSGVNLMATPGRQWMAHDQPWQVVSLCVWRNYPHAKRLYVALSSEGEVELMGPGGEPTLEEHIEGAGLTKPWSRHLGYLNEVRRIGSSLYVCGGANQVYRRSPDSGWELISQEILVDPFERQNLPSPMSGIRHLHGINGRAENDIYVAGLEGEVHHYDGAHWQPVPTDTKKPLNAICILDADDVFVAGAYGTLLRGDARAGFRSVWPLQDAVSFTGIVFFQDRLFLASESGLYTFDPATKTAARYHTDLTPDLVDPHRLDVADGVLWSFGYKDLAYFDGTTWTRVDHPDNPPIR